ncbi:hypothetical protein FHR81_005585 [Actinoalloteichus hoggarensis]|uniref:Uncharacterized protein n=1 Tax=Actinoalloteichus hoggarensis TaxID=1470176 RepID=A0A221W7M0_9PSEU|nr:hypothetical protein [Actinoalloteichus hoggarensis]ASO21952.1 hypothetical protein AHOG_21680 [Actinoalloteichus hoggarensis]MBB5924500.1 hypothetical protein [Actinoalloteichus hoggarensis]
MTGVGPWFVRSVSDGDTHRAFREYWTRDGVARIRPVCDPNSVFTALNRNPVAVPYFDEHRCPTCLTTPPVAEARHRLVVVR